MGARFCRGIPCRDAQSLRLGRVGAAWRTKDGKGLNIKLDAGIALVGANDISITLWKNDEQQRQPQQPQQHSRVLQDDDDIPY